MVRRYFDELHALYKPPVTNPLRIFDDVRNPVIPDSFYAHAADLWQQAEAAVKDSPAHAYNVRMGAIPVLYARLARMPAFEEKKVWVTQNPQRYAVPPGQRARAATLLARCSEANNIRISENPEHHAKTLAAWTFLAQPMAETRAAAGPTRATVEDSVLALGKRGTWGDTVADPLAGDHSAMKLYNTH